MPARNRISNWFILLLIPLLILVLAACADEGAMSTPPPEASAQETPVVAAEDPATEADAPEQSSVANQAPLGLQIKSSPSPSIDPACLAGGEGFQVLSAPLPADGLEPGISQLFCATGAPAGATVVFTLVDPNGDERTSEVVSITQGDTTFSPLLVRFMADDAPGAWTLQASAGDDAALQSELAFDVNVATQPFITLLEPIANNTDVIRAGIGGLFPESTARFALYTLDAANVDADGMVENQANLLISTRLVADSSGRADLELDVADLPAGPYLLMLIPPGADLGSPPILNLPDQERLAIAANLTRSQVAAVPEGESEAEGEQAASETPSTSESSGAAETESPAAEGQSMTPQQVSGPMGVPRTLKVNLPVTELPSCLTTSTPTLQIWPTIGEIGDWWYGCATGFAPSKDVEFVVTLPNGEQTQFNLGADANGSTPFRWYAAPGEGSGQYNVLAKNGAGQAELSWDIVDSSKPHILVFPHNFQKSTGGEIYLSGFPAGKDVKIGLFQIDEQGDAKKVKQWKVTTTGAGFYGARFTQADELQQGHYVLIAQSDPTYQFPGVDTPASAIEFFSLNVAPQASHDAYSLFLGRPSDTLIAAQPTAEPEPVAEETPAETTEEPAAEEAAAATESDAAETPETPATEAAPAVAEVPPPTYSLPEDDSETPTCPDATPGESAVCVLPATMQQGTFAYILMHDFKPRTKFGVTVTAPNGSKDTLERRTVNADGYADAYWYALHGEPLGEYKIDISGAGEKFSGNLEIVEPTSPHLVIQPRSPKVGSKFDASVTGFDANEELLLAFYRSQNVEDGNVNFKLVGQEKIQTDDKGGVNKKYQASRGQKGVLFLVLVYRDGESEPAAQAVYRPGKALHLQYPFAWGQNYQEGQ